MATITLAAPDISCGHCKNTIESELPSTPGVRSAEVAIGPKQVTVDYDETVTGPEGVKTALEELGYPVAD